MKTGTYRVSFVFDLNNFENEDEAQKGVMEAFQEMMEAGTFPEVNFELLEEVDLEYTVEEELVSELNFS